jgi:hypothetical protein
MSDNPRTERVPAGQVRPHGDNGRPRPPGPEEKRGATATSAGRDDNRPSPWASLRTPRFWITLLVLLAINWFLVPLLFPEPLHLLQAAGRGRQCRGDHQPRRGYPGGFH